MAPLTALYCEIVREDIEDEKGSHATTCLDITKDLDYAKIPVEIQKVYLSEKF